MITTVPIKNEKDIAVPDKTVLVLGYFDGIHKGHQKLFEVASKASMQDYLPVVVLTFTESPKLALHHSFRLFHARVLPLLKLLILLVPLVA